MIRGLLASLVVAVVWTLGIPGTGKNWPLGLDGLFRTDLPLSLALLGLGRVLAGDWYRSRLERWLDLWVLPAAMLPFLPLRAVHLAHLATGLFVVVLGIWVIPSLAAAGRALRDETTSKLRAYAAFLLCLAAVYMAVGRYTCHVAAPTGDEPHYLMVAHSLWQDGDLDLADDFAAEEHRAFYPAPFGPRPWDIRTPEGQIYSWGGTLFPALLAVPYGLGGRPATVLFLNLVTALTIVLCYRLARRLGGTHQRSFLACLALGLGLPVVAYSSLLYPETVAGLLIVLALNCSRLPVAMLLLLGLALLRAKYLALALPAAMVLGFRAEHRGSRFVILGFLGLIAAYMAVDLWLLKGEYSGRIFGYLSSAPHEVLLQGRIGRMLGLWFDQEGGVFLYNPLIWVGLVSLVGLAKSGKTGLAAAMAAVVYALAASAAYDGWYGEWWVPGRFLVPVVFLLAVAWGATQPEHPNRWNSLLVYGGLQACILAVALILSPRLAYNYADGTASVLDELEARTRVPVCRYFPSLIRPSEWTQWLSVLAVAAAALVLRWRAPRTRTRTILVGVGIFLLVWTLPLSGRYLVRSRIVEVEDTLVKARRAKLWPPGRPYHQRVALGDLRLGLRLLPGGRLSTPIFTGAGAVSFHVMAAAQGGPGKLEIWLNDLYRGSLDLPQDEWSMQGVYTLKQWGVRGLELRNTGPVDVLVDFVEVH